MANLNIDHNNSGALQYMRAETIRPPEISYVLEDWEPIEVQNALRLTEKLLMSSTAFTFEARQNLTLIRSLIREPMPLATKLQSEISEALNRLDARKNETVEEWAEALAKDSSLHID